MKLSKLAKKYNYKCFWCKRIFTISELSRDHIRPSNNINRKKRRPSVDECVLSCKVCNFSRDNIPFSMYKEIMSK